ncbi:MAG: hypothetical protein OXH79_12190 [Boseongicola sp.]|nr:hypothetical protein [Boseongicola sp.]
MANRSLTQRLIDTLTPGKSVREIRDKELRGFGIRVLPSGRKSCFVQAQYDGRRARHGEVPDGLRVRMQFSRHGMPRH